MLGQEVGYLGLLCDLVVTDLFQAMAHFRSLEMILNIGHWSVLAFTITPVLLALMGYFFHPLVLGTHRSAACLPSQQSSL